MNQSKGNLTVKTKIYDKIKNQTRVNIDEIEYCETSQMACVECSLIDCDDDIIEAIVEISEMLSLIACGRINYDTQGIRKFWLMFRMF